MDEISNRTLAIVLIAAIVISLGGTLMSLNQLDKLKPTRVTGLQTYNESTGNVSLSIIDVTWINFTIWRCDFGTGFVTAAKCTLNSSGYKNSTGCSPSWTPDVGCNSALEIRNVGTNNVSLNISWSQNGSNFISPSAKLWYRMANGTNSSGASEGCHRNLINTSWTEVSTDDYDHQVCDDFVYEQAVGQYVHMHVQVEIPQTASDGFKYNDVTAYGRAI